jgi:hypothetical protein
MCRDKSSADFRTITNLYIPIKIIAYDTLNKHSILSIALASLYGAMEILNMKSLKHCLDECTSTKARV